MRAGVIIKVRFFKQQKIFHALKNCLGRDLFLIRQLRYVLISSEIGDDLSMMRSIITMMVEFVDGREIMLSIASHNEVLAINAP
jgi:hypothetical protein